jgi:hypothetical protein
MRNLPAFEREATPVYHELRSPSEDESAATLALVVRVVVRLASLASWREKKVGEGLIGPEPLAKARRRKEGSDPGPLRRGQPLTKFVHPEAIKILAAWR